MTPLSNIYVLQAVLNGSPTQIYHETALSQFVVLHGSSNTSIEDTGGEEPVKLVKLWTTLAGLHLNAVIAGWKISTLVLPVLVRRSMFHQVPVPERFRTDPIMRYSTVHTLDVNRIYTQGGGYMPDSIYLEKVLREWGIETTESAAPIELARAQYEALKRYFI